MQTQSITAPQDGACFNLFAKSIERLVDGTLRIEGLQMNPDPEHAEEERRLLATLLGFKQDAQARADAYTVKQLVTDFLAEGDRAKRWTAKSRQEMEAALTLLSEIVGENKAVARARFASTRRGSLPGNAKS